MLLLMATGRVPTPQGCRDAAGCGRGLIGRGLGYRWWILAADFKSLERRNFGLVAC